MKSFQSNYGSYSRGHLAIVPRHVAHAYGNVHAMANTELPSFFSRKLSELQIYICVLLTYCSMNPRIKFFFSDAAGSINHRVPCSPYTKDIKISILEKQHWAWNLSDPKSGYIDGGISVHRHGDP